MIGSIIGDIVGSRFEFDNIKTTDIEFFDEECTFTDDSVCTIATMDWLLCGHKNNYDKFLLKWCERYPNRGYGDRFLVWIKSNEHSPYNSFGNGAAMRVSPVGLFFGNLEDTLNAAKETAIVTHNHLEGIKGAMSTAEAIFLARTTKNKDTIKDSVSKNYSYNLERSCDSIRPIYEFDESCQGTVPESIVAFLDSSSFENAIRLAISLGGDSDTLACIAGGIAEAYYGVIGDNIKEIAINYLPSDFLDTIENFYRHIL